VNGATGRLDKRLAPKAPIWDIIRAEIDLSRPSAMKFTLSWLKTHLETDAPLQAIVDKLSMIGLEVEEVDDRAAALAPFTVGYVKEARPHSNADRLKVCIVETGAGEVQVVCGGPNARTGMKGVFAPAGSYIPGTDLKLKKGVIRGEESNGMLLSEREVGLSDEHEGIIELDDDAPVGEPFAKLLGLDDPVIDIAITPNRGDCLGVRGIARDLAAAGLGRLTPFEVPAIDGTGESPVKWRRNLPEDLQHACPYVAGKTFRGVTNGPSPKWLQERLRAIGLRPISALVDITNFVTFDLGRPLHLFDADKLRGDLTMRMARDGEEILALDGKTYALDPEMVVIADETGPHGTPQGIGGVMGGALTGCAETTTNVFLEVALFDPVRVAATGRRLGIISDARYRFERGLDPESADWGVSVAAKLITGLCGGEASDTTAAGEIPRERRSIGFRPGRVESLGGCAVAEEEQRRILADLGFEVAIAAGDASGASASNDGPWRVEVPGWRPDVEGEACLVEEILRLHGFEHLPMSPTVLDTTLPLPSLSLSQRHEAAARTALAWRGMHEAVTFSFLDDKAAALFGETPESLRLANPISMDLEVMRPSLLPNLITAAAGNADRGFPEAALFEVGPEYRDDTAEGQVSVAAGLRSGESGPRHWSEAPRPLDAFDAKGDALAVLEACGAPTANLQAAADAPGWYHPGRSGVLRLGPNVLAYFGEVHPRVLRRLDLKGPAAAFEVFLGRVPAPRASRVGGKAKPHLTLSPFQPVVRDFAFVVDEAVAADALVRAAAGADKALISGVALFDVYRGKGIEDGKKSLAIAVTLQPTEKTLTDPEIEAVSRKIVDKVAKATGGVLRA
jgi:phenylalanyl-tRNA synthetase beta chain